MRKMKVNIFASQIDRSNGIGNIAYNLTLYLPEKYDVELYTYEVNEEIGNSISINLLTSKKPLNRILRSIRLFLSAKHSNNEVSICMSWRLGIVSCLMRWITKTPYIVLSHGNEVLPSHIGKKKVVDDWLRKLVLKNADFIVANSKYTLNLTKDICEIKNAIVIHPGCGEELHYDVSDGKYILSIGRIEERKGFQYIVRAMEKISKDFPDYNYYIAGDGNYRDELEKQISLKHLENKCHVLGRVSETKKKELLANCTLLAMPSFIKESEKSVEGFGIVYLEANAYGKPVIGTNSGGIPDAIIDGETGIIASVQDETSIQKAIYDILSKTIVLDQNNCRQWAEKHHYSNIINQYYSVMESVLEK